MSDDAGYQQPFTVPPEFDPSAYDNQVNFYKKYDPNTSVSGTWMPPSPSGGDAPSLVPGGYYAPKFNYDQALVPKIGGDAFTDEDRQYLMNMDELGTGRNLSNFKLYNPKLIYNDPVYGRVTDVRNINSDPSFDWIGTLGPMIAGGAAGLAGAAAGAGSMGATGGMMLFNAARGLSEGQSWQRILANTALSAGASFVGGQIGAGLDTGSVDLPFGQSFNPGNFAGNVVAGGLKTVGGAAINDKFPGPTRTNPIAGVPLASFYNQGNNNMAINGPDDLSQVYSNTNYDVNAPGGAGAGAGTSLANYVVDQAGNVIPRDNGQNSILGQGLGDSLGVPGSTSALMNSSLIQGLAAAGKQLYDAGKYTDLGKTAANRADPFGTQRGQYQGMLSDAYNNPAKYLDNPAHKAVVAHQMAVINAKNAANGFMGSGKNDMDMIDYATMSDNQYLQKEKEDLASLSGAQFNPANAASMLMEGGKLSLGASDSAISHLLAPVNSYLGGARNQTTNNNGTGGGSNPTGGPKITPSDVSSFLKNYPDAVVSGVDKYGNKIISAGGKAIGLLSSDGKTVTPYSPGMSGENDTAGDTPAGADGYHGGPEGTQNVVGAGDSTVNMSDLVDYFGGGSFNPDN